MWPLEWLVITGDTGQVEWYETFAEAHLRAEATLGDLFEVQKIATFAEEEI